MCMKSDGVYQIPSQRTHARSSGITQLAVIVCLPTGCTSLISARWPRGHAACVLPLGELLGEIGIAHGKCLSAQIKRRRGAALAPC